MNSMSIIVPNETYVQRFHDDTEQWLNDNASYIFAMYGDYEPHPQYVEYIKNLRELLIAPEQKH